ncbi:MAG: MucB/RseB C-terminal domain-containing protein [Pseudomonadota bacterium]
MLTKNKIATACVILSVSMLAGAEPSPDPRLLINEMSKASKTLNYDGVFLYRLNNQMNTMRIIHKVDENGIKEKLTSLTGHAREVIRTDEQVKCYFPEKNAVVVDESRIGKLISSYLPDPIESISEFYEFEIAGADRVAGLDAWVVNIMPKDEYRYGYQLWIEKDSKLLLKSELKSQKGKSLEQVIFAQIKIGQEIDDQLLIPTFSNEDINIINNIQHGETLSNSLKRKWQVTWLPNGFAMSEYAKQAMMTSQDPVDHLVYSDGLAMVSIFVEKLAGSSDETEDASRFGGVHTYAVEHNGYQITAVGEVPRQTVKMMADSVKALN